MKVMLRDMGVLSRDDACDMSDMSVVDLNVI